MDLKLLLDKLKQLNITLASAESCTGGRVGAAVTAIPGASDVYQGGVIAYQNKVKTDLLGVNPEDILRYDVVSRQVAEQMVKGTCKLLNADIGVATTGYAGPSTGNPDIPVGTIWIACGSKDEVLTKRLSLQFDRIRNVEIATEEIFKLLESFVFE
jgi:nicotinamide-nucleotide amidase